MGYLHEILLHEEGYAGTDMFQLPEFLTKPGEQGTNESPTAASEVS
jgi:hypothetical protein